MDDLIERLRALSRHEHSDMTIGDEAADALDASTPPSVPVAVGKATARRILAQFLAYDPGDVWPPERQGDLRVKALQNAINSALEGQQPSAAPVGVEGVEAALQKWLDWCNEHNEEPEARSGARIAIEALAQQPAAVDEESLEQVASAIAIEDTGVSWHDVSPRDRTYYVRLARAALAAKQGERAMSEQPAADTLADTQRAIIEAAERRGYERAMSERPVTVDKAMTDTIEMLPMPSQHLGEPTRRYAKRYARAVAEHNVAKLREDARRVATDYQMLRKFADRETVRAERLAEALRKAEAALADIGDADREPGDDVAWCERRAAEALPAIRAALRAALRDHNKGPANDRRPVGPAA